jgi:hypothetical protein
MKKQNTLNANQVKFTHQLNLHNTGFDIFLRRCSTTKMFFELLDDQIPNQLLYNLEEEECYFLNKDCNLFKLKFEPVIMKNKKKNQTTEEYLEELKQAYLKEEIKELAIPWEKFFIKNYSPYLPHATSNYSLIEITNLFINLLDLVKQKQIKVRCGIAMMHLLHFSSNYYSTKFGDKLKFGTCEIDLELDFELAKYDLMYDDILLVGESITEIEDETQRLSNIIENAKKPKKKFLGLF